MARRAEEKGILGRQLSNYCTGPIAERGIVLGYACTTPEQITVEIKTLTRVFSQLQKPAGTDSATQRLIHSHIAMLISRAGKCPTASDLLGIFLAAT
ncbi:MAG: hypothetical protein MJK10_01225 [Pseudomonadales bacterium]|nr:hypothetical protein [Pseudomonadales bacterium]NRA14497.1 hypothetical protein [Oceanospirillaceae bacterium]